MSAAALGSALSDLGISARVEARDRLAVLHPAGIGDGAAIAAQRGRVVALASTHGFSHVALEATSAAADAAAIPGNAAFSGD